jgi:hypothetical protein
LGDHRLRDRLADNGFNKARSDFSSDSAARRFVAIYRNNA